MMIRRVPVGESARKGDRGSVTIWLSLTAVVMVMLVGIVVDLTGQVHAQQHARDVAAQAARVAGQQMDPARAVRGLGVQVSVAQAAQAAQAYLAASDVSGTVSVLGGTRVVVTTSALYQPKVLSIIGVGSVRVSGTAEARAARAVGGVER